MGQEALCFRLVCLSVRAYARYVRARAEPFSTGLPVAIHFVVFFAKMPLFSVKYSGC